MHDRRFGQLDKVGNETQCCDNGELPAGTRLAGSIGGNAGFFSAASNLEDNVDNGHYQVFVRDLENRPLGIGSISERGRSSARAVTFPRKVAVDDAGVGRLVDAHHDALVPRVGAEILEARIAHRPDLDDLYVKVEVDRLATLSSLGSPIVPMVYGVRITTEGKTYELRAQGVGGPAAQGGGLFRLFDCTAARCTEIADVAGGYGTVGENIVAAIPLGTLGLDRSAKLTDVVAFSGVGSYRTGAAKILDRVAIK